MTRPAPQPNLLSLPAPQMALARARATLREADVTAATLLDACAALEAHGDWMDHQTARETRRALLHHTTARRNHALAQLDAMAARGNGMTLAAIALTALFAAALLADPQPAPAAQTQGAADGR